MLKKIKKMSNSHENTYPLSIPTIASMDEIQFKSPVTFFVGDNGSGKSTLLEAVAHHCGFNVAGGNRSNRYDLHASESSLAPHIRLSWMPKLTNGFFLRAESFYQFSTHIDELERECPTGYSGYGGKSLHEQSHGESFLSLFLNRFDGEGIYLLDEPEAALSPARQLAFLRIMHDIVSTEESQLIIATHSPILLGFPGATILNFDKGRIAETTYEETDHYQITRYFLENRERYLHEIFKEED
ncbi:AAA family ATPase [Cytobacillus sp. FSL K6-0265]